MNADVGFVSPSKIFLKVSALAIRVQSVSSEDSLTPFPSTTIDPSSSI